MLLVGTILSALVLLALIVAVLLRALKYTQRHPELVTTTIPLAYVLCQRTLRAVIRRFRALEGRDIADVRVGWQSPGGFRYIVSAGGIEQWRGAAQRHVLNWDDISGVGVRMQPGFRLVDWNRDGAVDSRHTTGYTFFLLIVPLSGRTMSIQIPTDGDTDAVDFTATVLALADRRQKRINVFGFSKPPAPRRQRIVKY